MTLTDESMDAARTSVAAAVDKLTAAGIKAHGEVGTTLYGHAARSIIDDAIQRDVDVIVMGSRGRGDLAGLVLGSTAQGDPPRRPPGPDRQVTAIDIVATACSGEPGAACKNMAAAGRSGKSLCPQLQGFGGNVQYTQVRTSSSAMRK